MEEERAKVRRRKQGMRVIEEVLEVEEALEGEKKEQ